MKTVGIALMFCGIALLLAALAGIPYCFYIGLNYGWLDKRIDWAPYGMPASLLSVVLIRAGHFLANQELKR